MKGKVKFLYRVFNLTPQHSYSDTTIDFCIDLIIFQDVLSCLTPVFLSAININKTLPLRCFSGENKPLFVQNQDAADHVLDIICSWRGNTVPFYVLISRDTINSHSSKVLVGEQDNEDLSLFIDACHNIQHILILQRFLFIYLVFLYSAQTFFYCAAFLFNISYCLHF